VRIQPGLAADEACGDVGLDRPTDPAGKQRRFQYSANTLHAQRQSDPDKRWVSHEGLLYLTVLVAVF
jgi:hypothetical protein